MDICTQTALTPNLARCPALTGSLFSRRQCSSGLQAIASVAASIQAGFYEIGLAGGVESMSTNPMAWDGGVNPKIADNQKAQDCLLPMGVPLACLLQNSNRSCLLFAHLFEFHFGMH